MEQLKIFIEALEVELEALKKRNIKEELDTELRSTLDPVYRNFLHNSAQTSLPAPEDIALSNKSSGSITPAQWVLGWYLEAMKLYPDQVSFQSAKIAVKLKYKEQAAERKAQSFADAQRNRPAH
jgi:hypothetical protein